MAGLNDDGQWMILMALIISITIFILALIVNQSILVGKTTAEAVLEFPKSDIQDLKNEIVRIKEVYPVNPNRFNNNIRAIGLERKSALIDYSIDAMTKRIEIRYNNGITEYHEILYY